MREMTNPQLREANSLSLNIQRSLEIVVPFTTPALTRVALEKAGQLALDLDMKIRVVWAHVVPFPLPIDRPPVSVTVFEAALFDLLEKYSVVAEHYLTRDSETIWTGHLKPNSLIVLATPTRFWWNRHHRLAQQLQRSGHDVFCFPPTPAKLGGWLTRPRLC